MSNTVKNVNIVTENADKLIGGKVRKTKKERKQVAQAIQAAHTTPSHADVLKQHHDDHEKASRAISSRRANKAIEQSAFYKDLNSSLRPVDEYLDEIVDEKGNNVLVAHTADGIEIISISAPEVDANQDEQGRGSK